MSERCQTWGYYTGRQCEEPEGHEGRHRTEPAVGRNSAGRAVQDDGLPRLRTAIMERTDSDTGDVWLHREDADILRRLVRAAPPLHDSTGEDARA